MDEVDRASMESSRVRLADVDAALDASLRELFRVEVRTHLDEAELGYLDSITSSPQFDVAHLADHVALELTFHGGQTWVEWDGTAEDAVAIVRGMAESAAGNVSGDHWIQGDGWRSRTRYDGN